MPNIKRINHVAVVVDDMDKALSFWRDALGMELHELRDVPVEKSQVAFLPLAGSEVELVRPTSDDSGIAKYLAKRGPGMHHICLEVDDIAGMLAQLQAMDLSDVESPYAQLAQRSTVAPITCQVIQRIVSRANQLGRKILGLLFI